MENSCTPMEPYMKASDSMICSMAREKKFGMMDPFLKDNITMAKSKAMVNTNGVMVHFIKVIGKIIASMA